MREDIKKRFLNSTHRIGVSKVFDAMNLHVKIKVLNFTERVCMIPYTDWMRVVEDGVEELNNNCNCNLFMSTW